MPRPRTAYITGGASGIASSLTTHLLTLGWHVFISDTNPTTLSAFVSWHKDRDPNVPLYYASCDVRSWEEQVAAFKAAVKVLGRVDFVVPCAGVGEGRWLPGRSLAGEKDVVGSGDAVFEFIKPDLRVIDIDLTGVLYTVALAVQQFRRQEKVSWNEADEKMHRGKIGLVASVCGFYCVPALPIYTAAKHAIIGLTRSYGHLLVSEGITVNAIAPNVVRTGISSQAFYDDMEKKGLLTSMQSVLEAFDEVLESEGSGEIFECGPLGGWMKREGAEYLDEKSRICCEMLQERARGLHH